MKKYTWTLFLLVTLLYWSCGPSDNGQGAENGAPTDDPATWTQSSEQAASLLYQAQQRMGGGDNTEVKALLQKITTEYPKTKQAAVAQRMIKEIEAAALALSQDTIPQNTALPDWKEVSVVVAGSVTLNIGKVQWSNKWEHDRYPGQATVDAPEAGYQWLTADLTVNTTTPNPQLPPVLIYRWGGDQLYYVDMMTYLFTQWKSKDAYLGNQPDDNNNLAKNPSSASFRAGVAISDEDRKQNDLVVLVQRTNCVSRRDEQFNNPPYTYLNASCRPPKSLNIKDIDKTFMVVKIFRQSGG